MNHDVSAGRAFLPGGEGGIVGIGIGDAQGAVKVAVLLARGDSVAAFRGFVVALEPFWTLIRSAMLLTGSGRSGIWGNGRGFRSRIATLSGVLLAGGGVSGYFL
jgi:hypothetical protein